MSNPVLFSGKPLPLSDLSPDDFQGFVHASLQVLAPRHGFILGRLTGASGDGGFDCDGHRIDDRNLVCVQAKRFSTVELSTPHVAFELAKVALIASQKGAVPKEHYFITSGKVRTTLYEVLREHNRIKLITKAAEIGLKDDELNIPREAVRANGGDVRATITTYIEQLDKIPVWSGVEFDRQLGLVWSQLTNVIQRHFTVERVLIEHPRPDWDEGNYFRMLPMLPREQRRRLRASPVELPVNVRVTSAADPRAANRPAQTGRSTAHPDPSGVDPIDACLQVEDGGVLLLLGPGGAGKSTALRMTLHRAAVHRESDPEAPLPIYIPLGSFRSSLRALIEHELVVRAGNWESIPGRTLLLCDGLNELGPSDQSAVVTELSHLLRRHRTAAVITLRSTGLPAPLVFPPSTGALQLHPFTFNDIRELAAEFFEPAVALSFVMEIRKRVTYSGANLFMLPFGVAMLMHSFAARRRLPESVGELIEDLLRRRFDANEEILVRRHTSTRVPMSTLAGLARHVAVEMCLQRRRTVATHEEFEGVVHTGVVAMRSAGMFDADGLRDREAFEALLTYEMIFHDRADVFRFEHDIIAGHLVSGKLASAWSSHLTLLAERSLDEAWLLAARHVSSDDMDAFFTKLCETDMVLAACAVLERGRDVAIVESLLLTRIRTSTSSLVTRWEAFTALAILATPTIIAELRRIAAQAESDEQERALRALCMAGDHVTLARILPEVDRLMSIPGIRSSGGEISLWELAPPAVALALARERVDQHPNEPLVGSIVAIARFGDKTDLDRLLKIISTTEQMFVAAHAYFAATKFDANHPREIFMAVLASGSPSVRVQALSMIGAVQDDAEWLIVYILGLNEEDAGFGGLGAVKLLAGVELPDSLRYQVRAAYDVSGFNLRECLWSIARDHRLVSFESLAIQALSSPDSPEAGYAANFAINHTWSSEELCDRFGALAKTAAESDWYAYDWQGWRITAFLLSVGERELVGRALERRLRKLTAESGRRSGDEEESYSGRAGIDYLLLEAGQVADLIPADIVLDVFRLSRAYSTKAHESLKCMLARLDSGAIDAVIEQFDDPIDKVEAACLVAPLGSTESRAKIVGDGFAMFLDTPWIMGQMVRAAEYLWSDAFLSQLIGSLVRAWGPTSNNVREGGLTELAKLVSKAQGEAIIAPVLPKLPVQEHGVRQILQLWYELSQKARRKM